MSKPLLTLEILNGPLDGLQVALAQDTPWGQQRDGPLGFPWDAKLGTPQARFGLEGSQWRLETPSAPHGTYRMNREGRVQASVRLEPGDVLKAGDTWLRVERTE